MPDLVVDSCVVAKWILPEADSADSQKLFSNVAATGGHLIVLDLAFAEVANAIRTRFHRGLITSAEADEFLQDLETLPVGVEAARRLLQPAMEIAKRFERSIYDALFVALAHELRINGVTTDLPLHRAVTDSYPEIVLLRDISK